MPVKIVEHSAGWRPLPKSDNLNPYCVGAVRSPTPRVLHQELGENTLRSEEEIRRAVKESYASLALSTVSCCSCCDESAESTLPEEAKQISAGCGSPVEKAGIKQGMLVIDLGSGGGIDLFRAADLVGSEGKAIGVDSTPEMVWRARETAKTHGYKNVEFRLGEIEHLPIESGTVDLALSNCVINLSPDKRDVFREVLRVLKPGGRLVVSDIVSDGEIPKVLRNDLPTWASCISGATEAETYRRMLEEAGFKNIATLEQKQYAMPKLTKIPGLPAIISKTISATKPTRY